MSSLLKVLSVAPKSFFLAWGFHVGKANSQKLDGKFKSMEMFNFGFWLTVPVFLIIGAIPSLVGGVITYVVNKYVDEEKRLEAAIKVTLVLLPLFSCGFCNYWWTR